MPPSSRKPAAKADDEKPEKQAEEVETSRDDICVQCWPDGWPGQDNAAACEHGVWKR